MTKKRKKERLYNWLMSRHTLIMRNEENFVRKPVVSFSYAQFLIAASIAFMCIFTLCMILAKFVLSQWYDPAYGERKLHKQLVKLAVKVDSLSIQVAQKEAFIQSVKLLIQDPNKLAETQTKSSNKKNSPISAEELDELEDVDLALREEMEKNTGTSIEPTNNEASVDDAPLYFPPTSIAKVLGRFDPKHQQYGVKLLTRANEPVKAIADGIVLMASWTGEKQYVIAIQHANNTISLYKNNASALKRAGSFVKAGDPVGLSVGTDKTPFILELWQNGNPVDPAYFLSL